MREPVSQWVVWDRLGAPHPAPPPAPPGHRGPSLGVQFHRGVSHTDITDKGCPVPPETELILCGPRPNPTVSTDSQGGPRPPDRTPTRLPGRTCPGLRGGRREQRADLRRGKGSPWGLSRLRRAGAQGGWSPPRPRPARGRAGGPGHLCAGP